MTETLPDVTPAHVPEEARMAYAQQLVAEMRTLLPSVERMAEIVVEMRDNDLFRLFGHKTWEAFCTAELGMSKWKANRLIAGTKAPKALGPPKTKSAGQSVAAVQAAPILAGSTETEAPAGDVSGSPDPAFQRPLNPPEIVADAEPEAPGIDAAMLVDSLRRMGQPEAYLESLSPTELRAALGLAVVMLDAEGPNDTGKVPTLREEAASVFSTLLEATEGIGAKWTIEEATAWENRSRREMTTWRKANGIQAEPERRQGTISRPEDRANSHKTPHKSVSPPAQIPVRRHADDCRCYGCQPAKVKT